ncbi:O-antigen ligase family protein [Clostridium sp. SHJSY1]|uniref:O-antigen ligase family protein n=1 Tax=Clostridium sp. SHJSY1 TaxID=2942483 RepID=UPI00287604C9|nr:O-antigen ligase family protein [Clostridium sp. SHJSY1]MDS0526635.1 O-antigen ligase family protein [Clostridium sp. SHJSY1]
MRAKIVKKKKFISQEEKIMYYLLSGTVFFDFINGIFTKYPVGEVIRISCILISLLYIWQNKKEEIKFIFIIIIYFLANSLVTYTITLNTFGLSFDLKMVLKAVYYVVIYKGIKSLYHKDKIRGQILIETILNNLYYTPLLFIFAYVFGLGKTSYENTGVGFKGTFVSLNSINIAMIILFVFAVNEFSIRKEKVKWALLALYIAITMILLGTKSSMIFTVFVVGMYILFNIKKVKVGVFLYVTVMLVLIGTLVLSKVDLSMGYIDKLLFRQKYLFENRDLLSFLLSGRNWLFEMVLEHFNDNISFFRVLFGSGYFKVHNQLAMDLNMPYNAVRPIELDLIDIFFSYGVTGILLTYGYFIKKFSIGLKNISHQKMQPYFVSLICFFIFSLLGGHVFLEAISSTFMGICFGGWYIENEEIKKKT